MTTATQFVPFVTDYTIPLFERMSVEKIDEAIGILKTAKALLLDRLNKGNDIRIGQTYGAANAVRQAAFSLRMAAERDISFPPIK